MKTPLILTLLLLIDHAQSAEPPPEIAAAKSRYEAAIATATKPIRERYVQELQRLKDSALKNKDLDLAVLVDTEIKALAGTGEAKINTSSDLKRYLDGSVWSWGASPDESTIAVRATFHSDGRLDWSNNARKVEWAVKDNKTVTIEGFTFRFSDDYKTFSGVFGGFGKRSGRKLK